MAGPLILSNRLQRLQQSASEFGNTISSIRDTQRRNKLQDDAIKREEEERTLRMAGEKQRQQAGAQSLSLGELQLGQAQTAARDQADVRQLTQQAVNVDSGLPQFPVPMLREKAPVEGSQYSQYLGAGAAGADAAESQALKDRLLAKIETIQTGKPVSPKDLAAKREMMATERKNKELEFKADLDYKTATTARTKAEQAQTEMQTKKLKAEIDALARGPGADPEKIVTIEGKLRGEFLNQNKSFEGVRDAYAKIQATAKDPSAAGDLALIFNYMKMLDPGSTVREGEFANAQNAAGVPDRVRNQWNNLKNGERLNPTQRGDFLNQSKNIYTSQSKQYAKSVATYTNLAASYGVDPTRVTIDITGPAQEAAASPGGTDKRALAQQALNDPEATPAEKAQAQKILSGGR